ncbi:MAG: HD domain-containing protein [Actinobacteria bacterium]|nr:HD domain-containing protein [Actinomycetota bacterium]
MEKIKKQFINELEKGSQVDSVFLIRKKLIKQKKSGQDYCLICLQDKGGSIDGVMWTEAFDRLSSADKLFDEGDFVNIKGEITDYKGSKQLLVNFLQKIEDKTEIEYSDFIRTSNRSAAEMLSEVETFISSIKNIYLKKLLDSFFEDKKFMEEFSNATAAVQYHHAYKGGLIEHSLNVAKICDRLSGIYENLNRDLLITGAILHDIGKIKEYRVDTVIKITDEGRLLGHITIGYGMILEKIKEIKAFPEDLKERLLHIILSHHGQKEFGSPKRPKILEAFIVYHVDHMDADVGGFNIILEESGGKSDWSEYARNFERSIMLKELKSQQFYSDNSEEDTRSQDGLF